MHSIIDIDRYIDSIMHNRETFSFDVLWLGEKELPFYPQKIKIRRRYPQCFSFSTLLRLCIHIGIIFLCWKIRSRVSAISQKTRLPFEMKLPQVNKQDSSFQNWEVSRTIYSAVVELSKTVLYEQTLLASRYTHGVTGNQIYNVNFIVNNYVYFFKGLKQLNSSKNQRVCNAFKDNAWSRKCKLLTNKRHVNLSAVTMENNSYCSSITSMLVQQEIMQNGKGKRTLWGYL